MTMSWQCVATLAGSFLSTPATKVNTRLAIMPTSGKITLASSCLQICRAGVVQVSPTNTVLNTVEHFQLLAGQCSKKGSPEKNQAVQQKYKLTNGTRLQYLDKLKEKTT